MQRQYPSQPLIGVGAIIINRNKMLIVKRANEPAKGLWSVPGGVVELGEQLHEALKRETKEETGLEVDIERLVDAVDNIVFDEEGRIQYHYVLLDYLCRPRGGVLKAADDVHEILWVPLEALQSLPITPSLNRVIAKIGE
jgi:ADP-ribose pyrophosphatase YjhB (NUDIX family)